MDPITRSHTDNAVVGETMICTRHVTKEIRQDHIIVIYDYAVILKAYSIQALESLLFDKLLIMMGNFHIELAFYGATITIIRKSGLEFIQIEAEVLAEGSMMGFIKGKFYSRCTRIHERVANFLDQKLYNRFLLEIPLEKYETYRDLMNTVPTDRHQVKEHLSDPISIQHLQKYEDFFHVVMEGRLGPPPQFWTTYVFFINRVHREFWRCVKVNDIKG